MTKMTFDERIKWLDHKGKVYEIRDYGEDKIIVWDVVTDGQVTTRSISGWSQNETIGYPADIDHLCVDR